MTTAVDVPVGVAWWSEERLRHTVKSSHHDELTLAMWRVDSVMKWPVWRIDEENAR